MLEYYSRTATRLVVRALLIRTITSNVLVVCILLARVVLVLASTLVVVQFRLPNLENIDFHPYIPLERSFQCGAIREVVSEGGRD